jgi:hypothetical protein
MVQAVIHVGVNIIGLMRNAVTPVKTIRIVKALPCPRKPTIVNCLVLTASMMAAAQAVRLQWAIVVNLTILVLLDVKRTNK